MIKTSVVCDLIILNGIAFFVGFVLDYVFGEPPETFHPVVWLGRLIEFLEPFFINFEDKFLGGVFFWFVVVFLSILPALFVLFLFYTAHDYFFVRLFYVLFSCYIFFSSFSLKSLKEHALRVYGALESGDLKLAKKLLSLMVTRNTDEMDEEKIVKATVESVSENFVDAILSPMLYFFLFGVVGVSFYKAVNTLDSMVGYKNERYESFGKFSARADDVLNFLPARLSIVFIAIASFILKNGFEEVIYTFGRFRKAHPSPNSAHPMSAFAGSLKLRLGGDSIYFGRVVEKPEIGEFKRRAKRYDIVSSLRLLEVSTLLAFSFFAFSYTIVTVRCGFFV